MGGIHENIIKDSGLTEDSSDIKKKIKYKIKSAAINKWYYPTEVHKAKKSKLLKYEAELKQKERQWKRNFGSPQLEPTDCEQDNCPNS